MAEWVRRLDMVPRFPSWARVPKKPSLHVAFPAPACELGTKERQSPGIGAHRVSEKLTECVRETPPAKIAGSQCCFAFEAGSVWLLNPLILVISAHHHASKDGLAFPLAHPTSEEEGQGREDCTHDC